MGIGGAIAHVVGTDPAPLIDQYDIARFPPRTASRGTPATTPVTARYVLVWFTRLPSDGDGHYQVSVYSVAVDG